MVTFQAHNLETDNACGGSNPPPATITPGNAKWNTLRTVVVTIEYEGETHNSL